MILYALIICNAIQHHVFLDFYQHCDSSVHYESYFSAIVNFLTPSANALSLINTIRTKSTYKSCDTVSTDRDGAKY